MGNVHFWNNDYISYAWVTVNGGNVATVTE